MGKSSTTLVILLGTIYAVSSQEFWSNLISRVPEGVPGVDYPNYTIVPKRTSFNCRDRKPGFYADPETRCQAWHWCDTFLIRHSFLCPNMTVFNQRIRGCDWWYNVNCDLAVSLYVNNNELYQPSAAEQARQAKEDATRRGPKKVTGQPPTPAPLEPGLSASVPGFTIVDSNFPEDNFVSSATAVPSTEVPPPRTSPVVSIPPVVTSNPSTNGVLRPQRPLTRFPLSNGHFNPTVPNAIPIAFPPPNTIPQSTPDFDFDATLAAVTGNAEFSIVPSTSTTAGLPPIPSGRRRPFRFRPAVATFQSPAAPSTEFVATPTRPDTSSTPSQPGAVLLPGTTDFFETTLDVSHHSEASLGTTHDVFLEPVDVPTTSVSQDLFGDTESTFPSVRTTASALPSTRPSFSSFAPFPTRIASFRPSFPPTTQRALVTSRLTPSPPPPLPVSFNAGVPFGARIGPSVDNSATVRRSDDFSDAPAAPSTTAPPSDALRHRKNADVPTKEANTFPPFPTTTPSIRTTFSSVPTSTATTPKPTKPTKAPTPFSTSRRTFPSFPITTFKPSTVALLTRAAIDGTFGDRDTNNLDATLSSISNSTVAPSVSLPIT